ncbi:gamma-glutamyltransferase family protein [Phenylobacterium aquaticum]|uniref:gamma-glutamyltransferase family protein n=1 Tax=Phenylobacterium aquaticum TaxID=1763816 RepID=UPI002351A1DE|nr:gamma-glutamyltransferase family protein [Phenylobacterium aquaticum]
MGSGVAPRSATLEQMRAAGTDGRMPYRGPLAVSVPGMVDAYDALLARLGSRSFADLAQPAISQAEDGYALSVIGAWSIASARELIAQFPATAAVFLPGGEAPAPGSILKQPGLARTLRTLAAEGPQAFYRGGIAREIGAFMVANGGALSAEDLAGHATEVTAPLQTRYRGHTVFQTCLPSQGLILLEALNIIEQADPALLARGDAAAIHLMAEAIKLAYADRIAYARDPAFGETPLDQLLSKSWAQQRFAQIDPDHASEETPPGPMSDGDTTYLCVADGSGMMVSLIQSVSSNFGSGMVAGDTGVLLNNRAGRGFTLEDGHPNIFAPGKKTLHTLNCWMLADPQGRMTLVGGTPGGDGQPQWNLQMLVNLIDASLDVQAVADAPRWTVWPGTDPLDRPNPYELRLETRFGDPTLEGLEALGHRLVRQGGWGTACAAQLIARDPDTGVLVGGSDPRAEGLALGY